MGEILTKTVFLLKMSHIPPNYAFLLFWSIFGIIYCKLLFLVKKSDYLRKEHWNTQNVCFSKQVIKGPNPEENLDFFKQLFFINPVLGDKY